MDFSIKGQVFRWVSHICKDFESYAGREYFCKTVALAAIWFIQKKKKKNELTVVLKKFIASTLPSLIFRKES